MIINRRRESFDVATDELAPGTTIAGYRVERLLGSGGMGTVYEATQLSLKRRVALKVIAPAVAADETLRRRFRREGELQAVIDHPHVLPIYEAGEAGGRLFIAMRLVRGETLKLLATSRSLPFGAMLRILGDIAGALDSAHAAGLVHRDVKPQNILVEPGGHAYLADFGLSRSRSDETLTRSGQLLGSVGYICPEIVRGERVTAAAGIYSFACVIYECLVGLVPYPRESDHAVLHAHVWDPIPRPTDIRPELPPAVDDVAAAGMAKHPEERPSTAREIVRALAAALGYPAEAEDEELATLPALEQEPETDTLDSPTAAPPPTRSRGGLAALIAAAIVLGASAVGWATGSGSGPDRAQGTPAANHPTAAGSPSATYAAALSAAFTQLGHRTQPALRTLAAAKTPAGQARLLTRLDGDYVTAQAAVRRAPAKRRDAASRSAIAGALGSVASDYRRLARAARHHSDKAYRSARAELARDQARLATAVTALNRLGYRVR